MHVGEFIRKYRLRYRLSTRKFALLLTIGESGKSRLEKWEQGKGNPKENDAELIKKYFSVNTLSDLNEDYLSNLILELVPRGTLDNEKIKLKKPVNVFISYSLEDAAAFKAAIKILTLKIVELESKASKRPFSKVSLEIEKMMQEESKLVLDQLKEK